MLKLAITKSNECQQNANVKHNSWVVMGECDYNSSGTVVSTIEKKNKKEWTPHKQRKEICNK